MSALTATQAETLSLFTSGADALERAIQGLSEKELDYAGSPNGWTIRQVVHHIADDGDAWSMNFKKALATPGAPIRFEGFPGNDAWADALAFSKRPVQTAMVLIKAHRQHIGALAEDFPDAWERCVDIVDNQGQAVQSISVGQILHMLGEHLAEHVLAIKDIKRQHGLPEESI